jgi:hypothetical protein
MILAGLECLRQLASGTPDRHAVGR